MHNLIVSWKLNRHLFPVVLCALAVLFSNCNRQPIAKFRYSQETYFPGEVVKALNESKRADNYKWTVPDGSQYVITNVSYTLAPDIEPGEYEIRLEAFSRNGSKKSTFVKPFRVVQGSGRIEVGVQQLKFGHQNAPVRVFVNGVEKGTVAQFLGVYDVSYTCGTPKCLIIKVPSGEMTVVADNGIKTQTLKVKVLHNSCTRANFYY